MTVCSDAEIWSSPKLSKICPKSSHDNIHLKMDAFNKAQNVLTYVWAIFVRKFCHKHLLKIAQSGHTG